MLPTTVLPTTPSPAPVVTPKSAEPPVAKDAMTPAGQDSPLLGKDVAKTANALSKGSAAESSPSPGTSTQGQTEEEKWNDWAGKKASQIGGYFLRHASLNQATTTINLANARGTPGGAGNLSSKDVVSRGFALGAGKLYFGNEVYSFGDNAFDSREPVRMYEIPELAKKLHLLSVRVELRAEDGDARVTVEADADRAAMEERLDKIKKQWGVIVRALKPELLNDRPFRELSELLYWDVMVLGDSRKALRSALTSPVHQERDRLERVLEAHKSELPAEDRSQGLKQLRDGCREASFIVYRSESK